MLFTLLQDPEVTADPGFVHQLESVGWVDRTALAVLVVFFAIGIFKGLIWQVSRVAILLVAYVVSGRFGAEVGAWLARTPVVGGTAPAPGSPDAVPIETPETTLYLAYVLLFLAVLVTLSLTAMLLQKLASKAGLGFFDRLGGGVVGVATGAGVVLFGLFVVNMFFRGSHLADAAQTSHALRLSRDAVDWLGETVPDDLRTVISLTPLRAGPPGSADPRQPGGREPGRQEAQPGQQRDDAANGSHPPGAVQTGERPLGPAPQPVQPPR